jgi:hypothetical protein
MCSFPDPVQSPSLKLSVARTRESKRWRELIETTVSDALAVLRKDSGADIIVPAREGARQSVEEQHERPMTVRLPDDAEVEEMMKHPEGIQLDVVEGTKVKVVDQMALIRGVAEGRVPLEVLKIDEEALQAMIEHRMAHNLPIPPWIVIEKVDDDAK